MISERFLGVATIELPSEAVIENAPPVNQALFEKLLEASDSNNLPAGVMMTDGSGKSVQEFINDRLAVGSYILRAIEIESRADRAGEEDLGSYVDYLNNELTEYEARRDTAASAQQKYAVDYEITLLEEAARRVETVIRFSQVVPTHGPLLDFVFERLYSEITTANPS